MQNENDLESPFDEPDGHLVNAPVREALTRFNASACPYPLDRTVVELFEEQVQRTPEAEAIRSGGRSLTYSELNGQANRIAWQLLALGTRPEHLVALRMVHSIEVVAAILGILKAGAAYVPIEPTNPTKRVEYILRQIREANRSAAPVLVTDPGLEGGLEPGLAQVLTLKPNLAGLDLFKQTDPDRLAAPGGLAYVIYTSGSTGEPKGVMIEHRSLVNYIWWANRSYVADQDLVWPLFSSLAFDLTVTSIFTPLIGGGRIVVYRDDAWSHGTLLLKVVEDRAVNIMKLTPAHLALIRDMDLRSMGLRVLIVGGEDFKTELAQAITRQAGHPVRIYNEYGPTEATVGCMIHRFDPDQDHAPSVPIGIPAANMCVFVLDDGFHPVPVNVAGQLFLAGDGLARGYLNRPDLTQQRFLTIPDPRTDPAGSAQPRMIRVYQTGDLARWNEDGRLVFLGRTDHQVKIGGARIELGEIEARLVQHPDIHECVVQVVQPPGAGSGADAATAGRLAAYYVSGRTLAAADLRAHLAAALPDFMLPSYYIPMSGLPLTTNGKVDRASLPVPDTDRPDVSASYVEQRSETERQLAEIWMDALKLSKVGVDDDFFELGGKSLSAIRVLLQTRKLLGVDVPISGLFTHPTITQLAALIDQRRSGGKA